LSIAALSGPTASQNPLLFQIDGDVESVSAIAHLLPSASPDSLFGLNHSYLSNAFLPVVESVSAIAHLLPSASPDSLFGLNHSYLSNAFLPVVVMINHLLLLALCLAWCLFIHG
jgi:hypothetical protein